MNWRKIAESWLAFDQLDEELKTELEQIKHDDQAMQMRFTSRSSLERVVFVAY